MKPKPKNKDHNGGVNKMIKPMNGYAIITRGKIISVLARVPSYWKEYVDNNKGYRIVRVKVEVV